MTVTEIAPSGPDDGAQVDQPDRRLVIAVAVLTALGLVGVVVVLWRTRIGRRTAKAFVREGATRLAEGGAVRLADALVDEVLGAA